MYALYYVNKILFSEKDVLSGGTPMTGAAGWAGWAIGGVSSLTSKVYSKATKGKAASGENMVLIVHSSNNCSLIHLGMLHIFKLLYEK